ncbi:MAG TPA: MarR family transcriptional regulator [Rhabdochlamydiaceae bacterium]
MKKIAWKKITRFEGPENSPGFLLWQVSTKWRRKIEATLAEIGLTHSQFVLLASLGWLHRNQSEVSQVELARHCGTDITMTSQILRTLEKKGYIERISRKGDQRSKFPSVTESGSRLIEQAIPRVEQVDHQFFKKLGPDTKLCVALLQKLAFEEEA